jgi:hypothetical protein
MLAGGQYFLSTSEAERVVGEGIGAYEVPDAITDEFDDGAIY